MKRVINNCAIHTYRKKLYGFIVGLLCLCGIPFEGYAFQPVDTPFNWDLNNTRYQIRQFLIEDGLPVNSAVYTLRHTDGYVYIATTDGLVRYDGHKFKIFNTSNTAVFKTNRFRKLQIGIDGELWITDVDNNAYILKNGTIQSLEQIASLNLEDSPQVCVKSDEELWIASDRQLWRQTKKEGFTRLLPTHNEASPSIERAFISEKNCFAYYITSDGFYMYRDGASQLLTKNNLLDPNAVRTPKIGESENGTVWFINQTTVVHFIYPDGEFYTFTVPQNSSILHYIEPLNERELALYTEKGVILFDLEKRTHTFTNMQKEVYSLNPNPTVRMDNGDHVISWRYRIEVNGQIVLKTQKSITDTYIDNEGSIWVTTEGEGVFQIRKNLLITIGTTHAEGLENVYGLWEDSERNIWVSSFNNGVYVLNDTYIRNWTVDDTDFFLRTINGTSTGEKYIGGTWRIQAYKEPAWSIRYAGDLIQTNVLFEDSEQRFWVGDKTGLFLYQNDELIEYRDLLNQSLSNANSMQELESGSLMITTDDKGIVFLQDSASFQFIDTRQGLGSNFVRDVYVASSDTLWVALGDLGLNRVILAADNEIRRVDYFSTNDGLVHNSLHRIIKDPYGYFWINSNGGIVRIQENELNDYLDGENQNLAVQVFTKKNGLENNEGNGGAQNAGMLTSDGKLLFPNQSGIVYTRPEWHIDANTYKLPPLVIETIQYEDSTVLVYNDSLVVLPKEARNIQIGFTLPTFTSPEEVTLEYKMEGVNDDWQKAGDDRIAYFTNLPAGTRVLSVRGKLIGRKDYHEHSIQLNILPFFSETIWFGFIVFIGIGFLFYMGYRVLLRQSILREKKLNALVNSRTNELVVRGEELEEAFEQIKKLDESKSRFFTNFTHELRTPLSLILNPLEDMIGDTNKDHIETNKQSLTLMRRNAHRLKKLVNQLLDVSKLSAGELKLTYKPVQLCVLTSQIAAQFEHGLAKKEIAFHVLNDCPENLIYVDVNAWNHICTNLFSNAMKFTPKGGTITVDIEDHPNHVLFSVIDTGIGIPENELPHVFDTYYQGASSISSSEGTGIGLALVKGLIERMKGTVTLESHTNKGTTFTLLLRKGIAHIDANDIIEESSELDAEDSIEKAPPLELSSEDLVVEKMKPKSSSKVLLVDDNEDFRMYLKSVIAPEYEIMTASNGQEGLEALETYQPDIIVSDIMMPEMNGYDMMREIRNLLQYKTIPFIFLSAKDSNADIEKGINLGADIYLPKPVSNSLLLTHIKALLRREQKLATGVLESEEKEPMIGLMKEVHEIIYRHLGNPDLNIDLIASLLLTSPSSLFRNWRKVSSQTIVQTITSIRTQEAIKLVKEEGLSISEATYAVGYSSLPHFSKAFKKMYGIPPREYFREETESH